MGHVLDRHCTYNTLVGVLGSNSIAAPGRLVADKGKLSPPGDECRWLFLANNSDEACSLRGGGVDGHTPAVLP